MSKGKKRKAARPGGKMTHRTEPISKRKRMNPMARNLIVSSVVVLALAEVLLPVGLVNDAVNSAMYVLALILAIAALVVEYSGIGRNKFE